MSFLNNLISLNVKESKLNFSFNTLNDRDYLIELKKNLVLKKNNSIEHYGKIIKFKL